MRNTLNNKSDSAYFAEIGFKADKTAYCVMVVNPSNPDQNGEKLRATIGAIRENFLKCYIYLADTLDSHFCSTTAIARKRGSEWIESHAAVLGDYKYDLVRWDEVRNHPTFLARHENIRLVRDFDKEGRQIIHLACARYAVRMIEQLQAQGRSYDEKALMRKMINYALEEIAGLAVIRELTPYPEVYIDERYGDPHAFGRLNASYIDSDLTLPAVYPLTFYAVDKDVEEKRKSA